MNVALEGSPPDSGLERASLRVFAFLRAFTVAVQIAAVLAAVFLLEIPIPLMALVCAIAMLAVADVAAFIRVSMQPRRLFWALAATCVACYSALLLCNDSMIYLLLTILVPWFGIRICDIRFRHNRDVQVAADKDARERYVLGLATLAADTAHEMGTPLSTMSVVVGDLRGSDTPPPDWKTSVEVLWQQIQACKHSLSGLVDAADPPLRHRLVLRQHRDRAPRRHGDDVRPGGWGDPRASRVAGIPQGGLGEHHASDRE